MEVGSLFPASRPGYGPRPGEPDSTVAALASYAFRLYCPLPLGFCQFPTNRPALRQTAKPRELPLGKLATARLHLKDGVLQRRLSVEVSEHFPVAQRLRGLLADRPWQPAQRLRLGDESAIEHALDTHVDPRIKLHTRKVNPKRDRMRGEIGTSRVGFA